MIVSFSVLVYRLDNGPFLKASIMTRTPFLTVNNTILGANDIFALAFLIDGYDVQEALKSYYAVIQMALDKDVHISDEEIQAKLDSFRIENDLERQTTVEQWRRKHSITDDAILTFCKIEAYRSKLMDEISQNEIEEFFTEIKKDETLFCLFSLTVEKEHLAQQIADNIREGAQSFAQAINQHGSRIEKSCGGFLGEIPRNELPELFRKSIVSVDPGTLVGPFPDGDDWLIFLVADRIEPDMIDYEDNLRASILDNELEFYADRVVVMNAEDG